MKKAMANILCLFLPVCLLLKMIITILIWRWGIFYKCPLHDISELYTYCFLCESYRNYTLNYFFNHNKNIYITAIDLNIKSFKMQSLPVSEIDVAHFHKFNGQHCTEEFCYYAALKGYAYFLISKCYINKAQHSHLFTCWFFFLIKDWILLNGENICTNKNNGRV